jgi:dephospho-CoA kinase
MKIILGITGEMAAGKTTATEYIKERYGGVSFRFSTMLRDVLTRIHIEHSRDNLQKLSTTLRSQFGDDIMSKVIAKDVEAATDDIIVVEGIRRPSDVSYLKDLPGFHLIAMKADLKIRYKRITERNENPDDQTKTFEQFKQEQSQESEGKVQKIMKEANFVTDNNGNTESMYEQIDDILDSLRKKN